MDNQLPKYIPDQYFYLRKHSTNMLNEFINADFKNYPEDYWNLRDFIRNHLLEWHKDKYPKLEQELQLSKEVIELYRNGKIVYDLSPHLINILTKTDVSNIKIKDIKMPHKFMYLHFGELDNFDYNTECYEEKYDVDWLDGSTLEDYDEIIEYLNSIKFKLDGAIVSKTGYSLNVCLCFKKSNTDYEKMIYTYHDHRFPIYDFAFDYSGTEKNTFKTIYDENKTLNASTICLNDMWNNKLSGEIKYAKLRKLLINPKSCGEWEYEQYLLIDNALKLIVNSINYINNNQIPAQTITFHLPQI